MNTLTDLLLGVGQPRVSHFPDLCTLLYTYLSTLDYWTKIVYYLFTQTSPVAHTSALTPTYIKSQKLPNWPISKELGLGRMLLPHWKLLLVAIITYLCPDFESGSSKPLLNIGHGWIIASHSFVWIVIIHPDVSAGLDNLSSGTRLTEKNQHYWLFFLMPLSCNAC